MTTARFTLCTLVASAAVSFGTAAVACPFCGPQATFTDDLNGSDVVAFARLIDAPEQDEDSETLQKAKFKIVDVIKGEKHIAVGKLVEIVYFGKVDQDAPYLLGGIDPPNLSWKTPLLMSERGRTYTTQLVKLPAKGPERLEFILDYFENEDEMIARDAYDEFSRASYAEIKALKSKLDRDKIVGWIKDESVPPARRRMYFVFLGVCGTSADLPMLEATIKPTPGERVPALDSAIACYLLLAGEKGLPKVEEYYLKNEKADYPEVQSALMAIRFHGEEGNVIERKRLAESFHILLDRPKIADMVVADLARWEDWSVMPKLVELFKTSDEKESWIRVPVINYLRACPLPAAKQHLAELEKIDPESFRRAESFFPFGDEGDDGKSKSSDEAGKDGAKSPVDDKKPGTDATPQTPAAGAKKKARQPVAVGPGGTADVTFDDLKFDMEKDAAYDPAMLTEKVKNLAHRRIRISGYMFPGGIYKHTGITEFILVRDNQECCFGPGAALFDCVVVRMKPGATADFSILPISVEGEFSIQEFRQADTLRAIFHLDAEAAGGGEQFQWVKSASEPATREPAGSMPLVGWTAGVPALLGATLMGLMWVIVCRPFRQIRETYSRR